MEKITGLIDAPYTPFTDDGNINLGIIGRYAEMLVNNGMKGAFVNGSTGEGCNLTDSERMQIAQEWVKVAPKNFKVIIHVGTCSLESACILAKHAQDIGAWGVGAMPAAFPNITSAKILAKYCQKICQSCDKIPFYYYHMPVFSKTFVSMVDLLTEIEKLGVANFAGIKFTDKHLYEYNQCRLFANGKYDILHGQDETALCSLVQGGAEGCICGTTNYNGRVQNEIINAWKNGDLKRANEMQNYSQEVINIICKYRGNIVGGKRIMKLIGLDLGPNRLPFENLTDEEEQLLKSDLQAIDFFNKCNKV